LTSVDRYLPLSEFNLKSMKQGLARAFASFLGEKKKKKL